MNQLNLFDRPSRYAGPYPLLPTERSGHAFDIMTITDAELERLKELQEERLARSPAWPRRRRKYGGVPSVPLEEDYQFEVWFPQWYQRVLSKWCELVGYEPVPPKPKTKRIGSVIPGGMGDFENWTVLK